MNDNPIPKDRLNSAFTKENLFMRRIFQLYSNFELQPPYFGCFRFLLLRPKINEK